MVNDILPPMKINVQDVSRGGLRFSCPRALSLGSLINIDLPNLPAGEISVLLACVMHCNPQANDVYMIGCAFSDELGDQELAEFGGTREPSRGHDNRVWKRFVAHGVAEYRPLPSNDTRNHQATITNISPTGIGLILKEKLDPGTILDLLIRTKQGTVFDILACIVYLGSRPDGDWLVGCHFIRELAEKDLQSLL